MPGQDNNKYFIKYKYYKKKYREMVKQQEASQFIMKGCWDLLNKNNFNRQSSDFSPSVTSTPSPSVSIRRKLSFTSNTQNCSQSDEDFEPGSNKWDCLSDAERERLLNHDDHLTIDCKNDPDETFYQPDSDKYQTRTPTKEENSESETLTPTSTSKPELDAVKVQTTTPKRKLKKTPEHVCAWPRCKQHHQFFESSKRKMAKMSPEMRKMATNKRLKSPKNFWSLDMPSTQTIRSRNQDEDDNEFN